MKPRIRPHNHDAEQAVLGAMLIDEFAPLNVFPILKPTDFFTDAHAEIYTAMRNVVEGLHKPLDFITLTDELERTNKMETAGGIQYIGQLTHVVPSAANHMHYVEIVRRDSIRRRLIDAAGVIIEKAYEGTDEKLIVNAEKLIYDISAGEDKKSLVDLSSALARVVQKLDKIAKEGSSMNGVATGFPQLDKLLHGFQPSDLIILGARPSVGKTAFTMNIVQAASQSVRRGTNEKCVCAVFSMEMADDQLAQRMLCAQSGISMSLALSGIRDNAKWQKIFDAQHLLSSSKIFVDDTSEISVSEMLSKCRRLKAKHGLDLVAIDYLQLMDTAKDEDGARYAGNRNLEIGKITRRLKMMAKELNVPVLLLSQLKRPPNAKSKDEDSRPELIDLRDSGSIEQDADVVMFLHKKYSAADKTVRPSLRNRAELIVAKHRNGECDTIPLYWHGETVSFIPYDTQEAKQQMHADDSGFVAPADTVETKTRGKKQKQEETPAVKGKLESIDEDVPPPPDEAPDEVEEEYDPF